MELLGIAAFRVSPVWVFAALAELSPYLRACVDQFSRRQRSITERIVERIHKK